MTAHAIVLALTLPLAAAVGDTNRALSRADMLDKSSRHEEAIAVLTEANAGDPDNPEILRRLSKQYSDLMRTASKSARLDLGTKALTAAGRAKELAPGNAKVRLNLAIVYGRIALSAPAKKRLEMSRLVREETEASIAIDPRDPIAWHILGRWNYEIANLNPILKSIAQAVFGKLPDASNARAVECFTKAHALDPGWAGNQIELGRALAAAGDTTRARREIEAGCAKPPSGPDDEEARLRGLRTLDSLPASGG